MRTLRQAFRLAAVSVRLPPGEPASVGARGQNRLFESSILFTVSSPLLEARLSPTAAPGGGSRTIDYASRPELLRAFLTLAFGR